MTNLANYLDKGITPQQFIDGMSKNQDTFIDWQKKFRWNQPEDQSFFQSLRERDDLRCLILAADWCGDVVRNVPVVFQVVEEAGIPTRVLIMEEHLEVMDQFLTMGGRAIPIVIFTDAAGNVLGKWGPRPQHVQAVMVAFKQTNPDRNAPDYEEKISKVRAEMKEKYGEGTGYQDVIVSELRQLLATF